MITYTTPTQQAMARIATAPATSDQGKRPPPLVDRLIQTAGVRVTRCPEPCDSCTAVALEPGQVNREHHGGSSSVADWLEGFTHTGGER
jgi:hypothetical protein